jgi:hypothetical protein
MVADTGEDWLKGSKVVATDLAESYRAGLSPHFDHAVRVADPFYVVRVANRCLDTVRRRVQNDLLGHRGRKNDPLYRIRKLLVSGAERLDERGSSRMLLGLRLGDPDDAVLGAWLAKESVRDVHLTDDPALAAVLLDKAIAGCLADEVPEIRSLGNTLQRWRSEILNHHRTGASNGGRPKASTCAWKSQARRPWFRLFRPFPPSSAASCRWSHLAVTTKSAADPNELSPLKRVDPQNGMAMPMLLVESPLRSVTETAPRRRWLP